jgi:hypothetical protein
MPDLREFQYQTVPQYEELTPQGVRQLFVPGRGRDEQGNLSPQSVARYTHAADFCLAHGGVERIVCAGYKTPPDKAGEPWIDPEDSNNKYQGIPEAYADKEILLKAGVPEKIIKAEPHSVDTGLNFVMGRAHLIPGLATGIVAQIDHLERMLDINAPRTLSVPFLGLIVPEITTQPGTDSFIGRMHSKYVLHGITPDMDQEYMELLASRRSRRAWQVFGAANAATDFVKKLVPNF